MIHRKMINHNHRTVSNHIKYLACGYVKENYKEWIISSIKYIIANYINHIEQFQPQKGYKIINNKKEHKCIKLTTDHNFDRCIKGFMNVNKALFQQTVLVWNLEVKLTGLSTIGIHGVLNNKHCSFNIHCGQIGFSDGDIYDLYSEAFETFERVIQIICNLSEDFISFGYKNYYVIDDYETMSIDSENDSEFFHGSKITVDFDNTFYLRIWMQNKSDWVKLLSCNVENN